MTRASRVVAVLGPTNTGKTHYAIERMLGYRTGIMGFPLRLLAREVYDKVVAIKGPSVVALVTGEERIVPPRAAYWICTIYKMDTLGLGDVKLMAAAGLWLGLEGVVVSLIIGATAGAVHGVIYWVYLKYIKKQKTSFHKLALPAGPGFIAGIIATAFLPGYGFIELI